MHARVIDQSGFMDIDIDALVGFHLQGGLHAAGAERSLAVVAAQGLRVNRADFGEAGFGELVFLGVEVSRDPPRGVVACEVEFGELFHYAEIWCVVALREFVAKSETVIEEAEAHVDEAGSFLKVHEGFVVMVADL